MNQGRNNYVDFFVYALWIATLWTGKVAVSLEKYGETFPVSEQSSRVAKHTNVESEPMSVITPTCSLTRRRSSVPDSRTKQRSRTHFVTVSKSFLYTHLFSPMASKLQIRHA